jgi:hypothetical protein
MAAILKDFAGPVATIFASIVAAGIAFYFSRAQVRIARLQADVVVEKLKFDLFEHRYAIYSAAKELVEYISCGPWLDKIDHQKVRSLYVRMDEGRFFLPPRLVDYLRTLQGAMEKFLTRLGERDLMSTDDPSWRAAGDELAVLEAKLREMYAELPTVFEEALAFKQIQQP